MSKFKFYITMNCVSFTVLVLIYTVLCVFGMSSVNEIAILILLLMTTCIAAAIFFADKLPVNSAALRIVIDLAIIVAVVFGIGGPTGFIPLEPGNVLVVMAMIIAVYRFFHSFIFLLMSSASALFLIMSTPNVAK